MAQVGTRDHREATRTAVGGSRLDLLLAVVLAYVPFFLSSPGRLSSDTKQYLYLDPGQFLSRIPWLWDSQVAAGTVAHQHIGYLFPMGPFYWAAQVVGLPDWIAQRLWLGTISLAALVGARWLFTRLGVNRAGANAGALVYGLTPFQLAFTARISVLLLPWAALPWLVGLTMRAARRGGWREPALIALIVLTIGGVNAPALLLVAVGPALWLVMELFGGRERAVAAVAAAARIAGLSAAVSLWWAAGTWAQGSYGLPVLQLTENVRTVAAASSPGDVLRGLGNWFFYGYDQSGYALVQTQAYLTSRVVVTASYLVPAIALAVGGALRWRHRAFFGACIVVGTVLAVGAWPYDHSTLYGSWWKSLTDATSAGLAFRNSPRVVPVVVLGVAGLIAAGVGAITIDRLRILAAAGIAVLVALAFLPVWRHGYLTPGVERPNDVPAYWHDAVRALDRAPHSTRILEIPGSSFATYRWGNTVEPVTPGLTTRPYIAREVLPYGSAESVNLLDAFDRRMQNGTFEPTALAPVARYFGVGTVALRSDLAYERSGAPRPRDLWSSITTPLVPGLSPPSTFGPRTRNQASQTDAADLRTPADAPDPPPVALFPVRRAVPIVRAAPDRAPVVLSGDGDGIVDTAAAGLLTGRERLLETAALSDAELAHALDTGAALVLTDSNRRRITSYFASIRDTHGATARAGHTTHDINGYDATFDPFPNDRDTSRTIVEQHGGTVDATADGGPDRAEDHAAKAFDGDLRTSWRVGGVKPVPSSITLRPARPPRVDHLTLVQPQGLPRDRWITRVRVTVNDRAPFEVTLGDESFAPTGQRVAFPAARVARLKIDVLATNVPPFDPTFANAVGFAEIRLDHVRIRETVRLPVDLTRRVGRTAAGHALAVVMTRLRQDTATGDRLDEELDLDRRFSVPEARTFSVSGVARVAPEAPDQLIDQVLGTTVPGTEFRASSHLHGDIDARASRAFDGSDATAWTSASGAQPGQWIEASSTTPVTVDHVDFTAIVDAHHTTPTSVAVVADGTTVATVPVKVAPSRTTAPTPTRVALVARFAPIEARTVRLVVTTTAAPPNTATAPLALDAISIPGISSPPVTGAIASSCRSGLLRIDGVDRPVRITGTDADARRGLALSLCSDPLSLARGSHTVVSARGWDTAIDVDRLVLGSDRTGAPAPPGPLVHPGRAGTQLVVHNDSPSHATVTAHTDGRPFWLVLGQSHNRGWHASVGGHALATPALVDGYANAWLIRPTRAGTLRVSLDWSPQRVVWIAIGISLVAVLLCLGIVIRTRRRRDAIPTERARWRFAPGTGRPRPIAHTIVVTIGTFAVTTVFSRPAFGVAAAVVAAALMVLPRLAPLAGLAAGAVLVASRVGHRPELAWLALALFTVGLIAGAATRTPASADGERAPSG